MKNKNITTHFIIIVASAILILTICIAFFSIYNFNLAQLHQAEAFADLLQKVHKDNATLLTNNLYSKGKSISDNLSQNCYHNLKNFDYETIEELAENAEKDPEVSFVNIKNSDGHYIYKSSHYKMQSIDFETPISLNGDVAGTVELKLNKNLINRKIDKVSENIKNLINSESCEIEEKMNETLIRVFIVTILGVLIICLVIYLTLRKTITQPIRELKNAAESIAGGNLDINIPVKSKNEIGLLSSAMNTMTESLRNEELLKKEIQERKRIEQDLIKAKKEADLYAKKALQAAKAKSDFLANMSHEIRTPMNGVIGMAELLSETELNKEQKDFVNVICESGDSLLVIINDILDFSKIESGKLELEKKPLQLLSTIENIYELFKSKANSKKIELLHKIEHDVPHYVEGDIVRIKQILINLVGNALKFTQKGEILISLKKKVQKGNVVELEFSVKDTGIGIPESKKEKLFKAFSQLDASTTRQYGGTGLGLAISKRLIDMMGGTIRVESEEGKGANFIFTLKVPIAMDPMSETHFGTNIIELKGKKALIVDDNINNQKILSLQCEKWGMVPTTLGNPEKAIEILKSGEVFDIGLIDMDIPLMDGAAVGTEIRKIIDADTLPLLMLSSVQKPDNVDFTGKVFAGYLSKPIKQSQLFDALRDILSRSNYNLELKNRTVSKIEKILQEDLAEELPLNILLAEDNPINIKLSKNVFSKMGYDIDIAKNGKQAVDMTLNNKYDIVFMDCQMPVMNGYDATGKIRDAGIDIPIIAMTANAMEGDKTQCLNAGMNDYISKPIKLEKIQDMVKKYGRETEISDKYRIGCSVRKSNWPKGPIKS